MVAALVVELSQAHHTELERECKRHAKAYVRERAAAILKVAAGRSVRQVAEHELLVRHEPETVSGWIRAYQAEGMTGLLVKAGRGRKPSFSPSPPRASQGTSQ